ncbi:undecaprenyl-phosphate glucose phosphotransferase [bacterium]|nr:undecaprenyl-phosphate glucose phosphotransferase [bacterium]
MVHRGFSKNFYYLTFLADSIAAGAALLLAYALRFSGWPVPVTHDAPDLIIYLQTLPIVVLVVLVSYQYAGLYIQRRGISGVDEFSRITRSAIVAFLMIIGMTFFYRRDEYSRLVMIYAWLFTIILTTVFRSWVRRIQVVLRRRGVGISRLVLVGLTQTSKRVAEQVKRHPGLGYRLVGVVSEQDKSPKMFATVPVLGGLETLPDIIKKHNIDEVLFALPATAHAEMEDILLAVEETGVEFKIVSDLFGIITNPMSIDQIYGIPVFALKESPLSTLSARVSKRMFDLAFTVPGMILIFPVFLFLALIVKLTSPGPVFFKQERVGRGNKSFGVFKFRSMRMDAEKESGPVWATKGDARTTKIGSFMRRTSLDELPQLINILKGEMSLVGPRPERPYFVKQFKTSIPRYLDRHKVKAGLTGWAQVHGLRGDTPIEERTKYDLWYVENWSLVLDLKIIIRTTLEVFHHTDAY